MNQEQLYGILRAILASSVGYAAAKGWISPADSEWLVGGVATALVGAWSWWSKKHKA
jgi:hypothetical protein